MKNPEADQPNPDDWENLFRQRFAEFQSEPPDNALARILASLPRATPAPNRQKAWLMGGLGMLLFLGSFWFVSQYPSLISTRLTTKSVEARQPTPLSAEQPRDAATILQYQRSRKATNPLTDEVNPEAVTPNKSVTTSNDKAVNRAEDKTGIDYEGSEAKTSTHKQETLAAAPGTAPLPTGNRENTITGNALTAEVEAKHSKDVIRSLRIATKATASAKIRYSTESNRTLLAKKNRASETEKLAGSPSERATNASQASSDLAVSQMKSTKGTTDKPIELRQQTADSPASPQTVQQPSDKQSLLPVSQAVSLEFLTNRPLRPMHLSLSLPDVTLSSLPQSTPQQPAMSRKRPVIFIGVMPLFTYQQIVPVATDAIWVKNVRSQTALSAQRAGLRLQAGIEWPLSQRVSLRTSLIYNQLNQQVSYATPTDKPDSIRVERVDDKTVQLTPYYSDKQVTRQTNWHYVGIGSDLVVQIGKLGAWRHYASAGASVGTYLTPEASQTTQPLSGFVQAAYGVERPLTPSVWLRIAPTVQYGLSTINDSDGLFHSRPYTYGVTISLRK